MREEEGLEFLHSSEGWRGSAGGEPESDLPGAAMLKPWAHPGFICPHPRSPQAFTVIDQNRDGIIDKEDLRDTFAAMGESLLPSTNSESYGC